MIQNKYIYIALIIYITTAYFSMGHNSPDEYYQILEFASFKLGLSSEASLTWEFHKHIRSGLQPLIVFIIYKIANYIHVTSPFIISFITRIFAALLSLISIIVFIKAFIATIKDDKLKKWFILLSLFTWLAVYNSVRFSAENFSAKLFLLSFSLIFLQKIKRSSLLYYVVGLLMGLAFITRFQILFMIFGIFLYLIIYRKDLKLFSFSFGFLSALLLGIIIDKWLYGIWVFTPFNYLYENVFNNRANSFGTESWFYYLITIILLPYGPLYVFSLFLVIFKKFNHPVVWLSIPFVFAHTIVGHKELRFLIPLLSFMPLLLVYSCEILNKNFIVNKKLWYFNCFLLSLVMLIPSAPQLLLCKKIYNNYHNSTEFFYITEGGNELNFYKRANVKLINIHKLSNIKCNKTKNCLLALTCQETVNNPKINAPVVFSHCPKWIFRLDFNNWLERTALYNVYELNSVENK